VEVCVVGAGSLGSAIGGVLALAGNSVTLLTRNAAHVGAVERDGLRLDDGEQVSTVRLRAVTDVSTVDPVELLNVLVKSVDTEAAVTDAFSVVGVTTTVVTLQNGVGCEAVISDIVGRHRVVVGRTFVGGRLVEPGLIEYGVAGRRTTLGELDGPLTERIDRLATTFRSAGMAVDVSTDILAMMWEKLFVNVATGALSALTGLPYGELSIHPDVETCAVAAVAEAIAVARALDIAVATSDPGVPWRRAWEGLPYGFKASMLQSVEKGSRTEVDVMHGAVCSAGRACGVATPVNDTLLAAVKGLERRLALESHAVPHESGLRH
jgi:2-dehydropantoate 2-reductase